jgi:hypothetical protein
MAGGVTVKVREGPKVTKHKFDSVDAAMSCAREQAERLAVEARRDPAHGIARKYQPVEQVAARVEVSVPASGLCGARRAGIDVRGDGSIEAFSGSLARSVVQPGPGEDVYDALRHALSP